jgi:hypothetical protein
MTEYQREEDFLAELLDVPEGTSPLDVAPVREQPILTRREERALLDAANQAGTPTLAPQDGMFAGQGAEGFVADVTAFVRRHPIPSLLAGAGLAFLLARSRR